MGWGEGALVDAVFIDIHVLIKGVEWFFVILPFDTVTGMIIRIKNPKAQAMTLYRMGREKRALSLLITSTCSFSFSLSSISI